MQTRRGLARAAMGTVTASVLVWTAGWAPLVGPVAGAPVGVAAGSATAAGVLIGYSDKDSFYPGSPTEPPNTYLPYATGGFDNTGTGSAAAALAYNPYEDFAGAINGLAPPGSPEVPAGDLTARSRASVRGAPPQAYDASIAPEGSPTFGTMRATLAEEGPEARSEAAAFTGEPAPGVKVESATSRIRVSRADGKALSLATTVLKGVAVNDTLTFEAVTIEATSTADGGSGAADALVRVVGAAVNGTAVELTENGISVAGNPVALAAGPVADALRDAGIELVAPGRRTVMPGGDSATASAVGPSLVLTNAQGQRAEVTVGAASAVALLFNPAAEDTTRAVTQEGGSDPAAAPVTAPPLPPVPAAAPPSPSVRPGRDASARSPQVASGTIRGRTDFAGGGAGVSAPDSPEVSASAGQEPSMPGDEGTVYLRPASVTAAGPAQESGPGDMATETAALAGSTATDRTKMLYGVLGGLAALLGFGSLCVPRGDLWSDRRH